jgi:hypothetical protein
MTRVKWGRWVAAGIGAAALVVLGVTGAVVLYIHVSTPHWAEMERIARSFPAPAGYRVTIQGRVGTDCAWNPTGECPARFTRSLAPAPALPAADCSAVEQSLARWAKVGYGNDQQVGYTPCGHEGEMNGHKTLVDLVPGAAGTDTPVNTVRVFVFG